jgi:DNA repair protein RadC
MANDPPALTVHDLPDDERPRERLLRHGPAALSSAELLAIILRTGTAQENVIRLSERILSQFNGLHGLAQASPAQLEQIRGLGTAKAAQVLAAIELGRRASSRSTSDRPLIQSAADAADLVSDMAALTQEHVRVILLDSGRRVIATPTVYIGTVNASVLRVPEIFREAIARNSPAIVLAHNHPSGDPAPSPEDVEMTRVLNAAAHLLDIALVDHIIIGHQSWESLRELSLGFD